MAEKTATIRFPEVSGLFRRGPYVCGKNYTVPEDVAAHLVQAGAEAVQLKDGDTVEPHGPEHAENFATTRALVAAQKEKRAPEASKESAPAVASVAPAKSAN